MTEPSAAYAHELPSGRRAKAETMALRHRQEVRPDRAPRDAHEDAKFRAADRGRVFIRGRIQRPWGVVWDVLRIMGPGRTELVAAGIPWQQEAIGIANDTLAGRIRVAVGGIRGAFRSAGGGLIVPDAGVRPAEGVMVRPTRALPGETARIEVRRAPKRRGPPGG
jgi:hypothetical protein